MLSGAAGVATVALLTLGAWELTVGMARGGPMKHALAGLLHLAFHPRPERFGGASPGQKAALRRWRCLPTRLPCPWASASRLPSPGTNC
ncbi:hypothetical protein D9M68_981780 [compost metagenome]